MRGDIDFFKAFGATFVEVSPWRDRAACSDNADEGIFLDESRTAEAQAMCDACPVKWQCLDDAVEWQDGGHRFIPEAQRDAISMHRKRHAKAFAHDLASYA